jgi:hypothetical protein
MFAHFRAPGVLDNSVVIMTDEEALRMLIMTM